MYKPKSNPTKHENIMIYFVKHSGVLNKFICIKNLKN